MSKRTGWGRWNLETACYALRMVPSPFFAILLSGKPPETQGKRPEFGKSDGRKEWTRNQPLEAAACCPFEAAQPVAWARYGASPLR